MAIILLFSILWFARSLILPLVCEDPLPLMNKHFDGGAYKDRNGQLLRIMPSSLGDNYLYAPLASFSPILIKAVLTAEDQFFYSHPGISPLSILRAAWQNIKNNRIISGASTITQQLIRINYPRKRTYSTKISEALMALRLELSLSKDQILELYLNSATMFGNTRGIKLASLLLFAKAPDKLNVSECAILASIIQAPGRYNPAQPEGNQKLSLRKNFVLRKMFDAGYINKTELEQALKLWVPTYIHRKPFNAPHFCEALISQFGLPKGEMATTIDMQFQNMLVDTLSAHTTRLRKRSANQIGAIILNSKTLEILAYAGSAQYGPIAEGYNSIAFAKRSGGSVLKPFLYALALEKGCYPSYIIPDTMQTFKTSKGDYQPFNADRNSYGPVKIRTALGNSLNVPAVKMLNTLGINDFYKVLIDLDILPFKDGAALFYGLGLAIGNPEIRMIDLCRAFSIFTNQGKITSLKWFVDDEGSERQIISAETAYMVFDMLSDPTARLFTFGNPQYFNSKSKTAIKTGTSTAYRDCWLVAVNSEYIIAIWAGNFNGQSTTKLSGASACGPIYKNIIDLLDKINRAENPRKPDKVSEIKVCSFSGQKPSVFCPSTGIELICYSALSQNPDKDLPVCTFHKSFDLLHELSTDYASWLDKRKRYIDSDPFELETNNNQNFAIQTVLKIVSPHDGDIFVLSSDKENIAELRAIPNNPVSEVLWIVNGMEFARTEAPYEIDLPLTKGNYSIMAIADDLADEIHIKAE